MTNWIQGVKHALTNTIIFKNLWEWDRVRSRLTGRCQVCDTVISSKEFDYKEIIFECTEGRCNCPKPYTISGLRSHKVCEVCDAMYRALYVNYGMKSINYFKNIDEREKKNKDNIMRGGL